MDIKHGRTTRRSMLGFLGIGTAALASRGIAGCGGSNANVADGGGGFDSRYNYPDGVYNVPDTDAGDTCTPTRPDAQGPFFAPGAPRRFELAGPNEPGELLSISGEVVEDDCATPIAGALLDVWQADAAGNYHDAGTEFRLRGQMLTRDSGSYGFTSIKPGSYETSPGAWRPAHIHFTVSKPGFVPVTTQLYFVGDQFLPPNDSCTGCGSDDHDRVIPLLPGEGGILMGEFKIILRRV